MWNLPTLLSDLLMKEMEVMAKIYARKILANELVLFDVPLYWRAQVKKLIGDDV